MDKSIQSKAPHDSTVVVRESKEGKFSQEIIVGNHILKADEPIANGGDDLGPSPYDFILAGLGACTAMTVRMYANLKKIPLEKIIVKLTYNKIYAEDCINCENENAMLDHINRGIELREISAKNNVSDCWTSLINARYTAL